MSPDTIVLKNNSTRVGGREKQVMEIKRHTLSVTK